MNHPIGPSVLLCDDAPFVRMLLAGIAARAGYEIVAEASTGEEAVEAFERHRPDIVIMDLVLPGINGIEATRQIRALCEKVRIVICSAMCQDALIAESLAAGANTFLSKPPTRADLLLALASTTS